MRAASRLERALARSAAQAGAEIAVLRHASEEWRSVTFAGARHRLEASGTAGARLDAWLDALSPEAIALPGHLVAELTVECRAVDGGRASFHLSGTTVSVG